MVKITELRLVLKTIRYKGLYLYCFDAGRKKANDKGVKSIENNNWKGSDFNFWLVRFDAY
jgi:hypothetical protein